LPVAIESYQTWYEEHRQAQAARESGAVTPSWSMRRRSVISIPAQARAVVNGSPAEPAPAEAVDADDTTPFDVPAFLRRQP
jgi:hypothetical protein